MPLALELLQTSWKLCPHFGGPPEASPASHPRTSTSWSFEGRALGERRTMPWWHPPATGPPRTSWAGLGPGWRGSCDISLLCCMSTAAFRDTRCYHKSHHPPASGARRGAARVFQRLNNKIFSLFCRYFSDKFLPPLCPCKAPNLSVTGQTQGQFCGASVESQLLLAHQEPQFHQPSAPCPLLPALSPMVTVHKDQSPSERPWYFSPGRAGANSGSCRGIKI